MATRTSVKSGNWSAAGTWDTGIPGDGDVVIISSGHTVTFDVDQSGFATGIGDITITGTLTVSTSVSSYMKLAAGKAIRGTGTFNIGTSDSPIPFAVKFTLTGGAGWYIKGDDTTGLTVTVYGTEPTNKWVRLSADEAAGQTEWSIDTDLTGEANYWKSGDKVLISTNKGCAEVQEGTIASVTSTTLTVGDGLTAAKVTGDHVVLLTRNVTILQVATSSLFSNFKEGKLTLGSCAISAQNNYMISGSFQASITGGVYYYSTYNGGAFTYNSTKLELSGGVVMGFNRVFNSINYATMSGGLICGCNRPTDGASGFTLSGGKIYGAKPYDVGIIGNGSNLSRLIGGTIEKAPNTTSAAINSSQDVYINGTTFLRCECLLNDTRNVTIAGGTFTNNTCIGNKANPGSAKGVIFTGTSDEWGGPQYFPNGQIFEILDYGGTAGAYKAWTGAGIITSQTSVVPTGYTQANLMTLSANTYALFCFYPVLFSVQAGHSASVEVQLRKSAAMTNLPKVWLSDALKKPESGDGSQIDTFTMTDSVDTWESKTFTIDNSAGATQKDYRLLFYVYRQPSGSVYSAYKVTDTTAGGGGLLTNPGMSGGMRG